MKALLVVILICGMPTYFVGHSTDATVAGPAEWVFSDPEAKAALVQIIKEKPQVYKQEWADVVGGQCS